MYVAGSSLEHVEQQSLHMDLVCAAAWSASNACARDRDTFQKAVLKVTLDLAS